MEWPLKTPIGSPAVMVWPGRAVGVDALGDVDVVAAVDARGELVGDPTVAVAPAGVGAAGEQDAAGSECVGRAGAGVVDALVDP
jgi:hypothetical protein